MPTARPVPGGVARALDEARFGPARTLDLRSSMPTASQAATRAELWLRDRQMARAGEVLVITGRGRGSTGGATVRGAVERLLSRLKRLGVVARVLGHTTGAFVVTLAPIPALFDAPARSRHRDVRYPAAAPEVIAGLPSGVQLALRELAEDSLIRLGVTPTPRFVADEMARQFSILAAGIAVHDPDPTARLEFLIAASRTALQDDR